jgi:hypothetical protein
MMPSSNYEACHGILQHTVLYRIEYKHALLYVRDSDTGFCLSWSADAARQCVYKVAGIAGAALYYMLEPELQPNV